MAYERRTWYQRLGQGLNKFLIGEKDAEGKQELTNAPDSITQQGDVISADNLNDLEDRIGNAFTAQQNEIMGMKLTKVWENPDPTASFPATNVVLDAKYTDIVVEYLQSQLMGEEINGFVRITAGITEYGIAEPLQTSRPQINTLTIVVTNAVRGIVIDNNTSTTTKVVFDDCVEWAFAINRDTQQAGGIAGYISNTWLVPVAIYKVGEIYNS